MLESTKRSKNHGYVPLPDPPGLQRIFPDAAVVTDGSPGDSLAEKLVQVVEANGLEEPGNAHRVLFSTAGVQRLMGAPFRLVEEDAAAAMVSTAWLHEQVAVLVASAGGLFAQMGLEAVVRGVGWLGPLVPEPRP